MRSVHCAGESPVHDKHAAFGGESTFRSQTALGARSLRRMTEGGGAERDRTADLVNAIHALSQLSYS